MFNIQEAFKTGILLAKADYSAKQYYLLKHASTADMTVELCGAGEPSIGALMNKPVLGASAEIMHAGLLPVIYGGSVTRGDALMSDANGKAVTHTGTNNKIGIALYSGSVNEIRTILILPGVIAGYQQHYSILPFHLKLADLADGDIITDYIPGFAGTIKKISAVVTDPVTTGAKLSTLNLEIEATNVTGGVLALTSANMTPLGAVVDGTAITADNVFTNAEKISVEATVTTTFIEGEIMLLVVFES